MTIKKLVEKYQANRNYYLSQKYNETQLRADFLDSFFALLGWDIKNEKGKSTNEREVLLEEPLKEDSFTNTKKPDYTFRLFSERKFFLEAKKPSVKIETDNDSAKQVRRYGFTAKLKISVLSNFEYLAIYDCSQKVETDDTFSKSRVKLYHFTEYEECFEEIKNQIGYDSVYSGNFDKIWEHIEEQLRLFSVDSLFLNQINEWRLILGQEVFKHNQSLSSSELNDIVQSYLNSIIFLRVCEDRNLETYKTLLNFATNEDFEALVNKFNEADRKYNSGLFGHKLTSQIIRNNSSAFWTIIKQLYYPESTYSFSVFASDILGNIYEIFLGKRLSITGGQITLEEKPENIGRDVITTPTYIIQNILRETVLKYCEDKTAEEIINSSFADISCGSGAFLLETYQLVNDILVDYYLQNSKDILIQTAVNTYKLPFEIKRKILENCIFGVDVDFNAVEACKFGLLLKLLEDENNSSIPIPVLPELAKNIQFGNSLVSSNQVDSSNFSQINPFDFGETKFDVIVGNPPYMATEHMKQLLPLELPLYKRNYFSAFKQFDKYFLFIERGVDLLKEKGYLGYIVPSKLTKVGAGKKLRHFLSSNKYPQKVISFGANQIFHDKTTYTCLLILQKSEQKHLNFLEINDLTGWKIRSLEREEFEKVDFSKLEDEVWILVPNYLKSAFDKINSQSVALETLIGSENIYNGIQTSANNLYIHKPIKETENSFFFKKGGITWEIEKALTKPYFQTSSGLDNLNTYRPFNPNSFVIYPYQKTEKGIEFISIDKLQMDFPKAYEYLIAYKDKLDNPKRDIKPTPKTSDEWYRFGRHQSLDKCDVPAKIIVGVLSQGNKYAIDYFGTLISSGGTAGYCMITLPEDCNYSIYYIQALLNSKYLEWYSALIGEVFRGGYIARGTKVLKRLPIRIIDFNNNTDKDLHSNISSIQKELIQLQGKIDKSSCNSRALIPLERQFTNLKNELDSLLTELFALGNDDKLIPLISELYATH
ncbi:MAG: adenine methyltransferase [Calditrichaeota bacterium]|nr:MAG: adenine methyltransferase [Calditrichota bacterium]